MTIIFHDAVDQDGLFDILGAAFAVQAAVNTARGTTVAAEVNDLLALFRGLTADFTRDRLIANVPGAMSGFQGSASGLISTIQQFCRDYLIDVVHRDVTLLRRELKPALEELIAQMIAESESVDASTVAASSTPDGGNTGNGVIVLSTKRGDGLVQENLLAEEIIATATSDGERASLSFVGDEAAPLLSQDWPGGSGVSKSLSAVSAGSSLLANGDMEDEDDLADAPDDWLIVTGTVGTTLKMTNVEVQTVAITGTPTGGTYSLHWTNADGDTQTTAPLAFDATASAVQSALRTLDGLELVTVTATGTSPDFTHTVTFVGRGGNVAQLTSTNRLTGGTTPTITHGTTSAGTAQVFAGGKALEFDSDGSQLTTIMQRLTGLEALTAYAVSLWAICDSVPAAGVFTIDLVDGDGGSVIQDAQGANNALTFNADDLTTSWQHLSALVSGECVFRMPAVVPTFVYLRVRISTAVSNTTSVFVDHLALARMTSLYAGGPLAAVFSGSKAFRRGDKFTVTCTNDRAGLIQEFMNRNFQMAQLGLLLPSDSGGSETVPDSVVA